MPWRYIQVDTTDPAFNLALEEYVFESLSKDYNYFILWQNASTVVVGRHQNTFNEVDEAFIRENNITVVRRLSGGGAVYHDLGNLNFTFIMCKEDYDLDKQISVIQTACHLAGISAEKSGRNDILADGRKFSGNAFYQNRTHAYHHGTLMVDVDKDKLGRYLSPPKAKLEAKGVASVRSRVVNLKELNPELTIDKMKANMVEAFSKVYGMAAEPLELTDKDFAEIEKVRAEYASWEYLFGTPLPFTFQCESRFDWGYIHLQLEAKDGIIRGAKVYTDAMDWALPQAVENALLGCRFETAAMQNALQALQDKIVCEDLCRLLAEQVL